MCVWVSVCVGGWRIEEWREISYIRSIAFAFMYNQFLVFLTFLFFGIFIQDPIFFTGHRNGTCLVWDLRCHPIPSIALKDAIKSSTLSSSVVRIHPLSNSQHVILNSCYTNVSTVGFVGVMFEVLSCVIIFAVAHVGFTNKKKCVRI